LNLNKIFFYVRININLLTYFSPPLSTPPSLTPHLSRSSPHSLLCLFPISLFLLKKGKRGKRESRAQGRGEKESGRWREEKERGNERGRGEEWERGRVGGGEGRSCNIVCVLLTDILVHVKRFNIFKGEFSFEVKLY